LVGLQSETHNIFQTRSYSFGVFIGSFIADENPVLIELTSVITTLPNVDKSDEQ
jgi:hypothetical protein